LRRTPRGVGVPNEWQRLTGSAINQGERVATWRARTGGGREPTGALALEYGERTCGWRRRATICDLALVRRAPSPTHGVSGGGREACGIK